MRAGTDSPLPHICAGPGLKALTDSERQLQGTCTTTLQEAIVRPRQRRHPYGTQNRDGTWRQPLQGQRMTTSMYGAHDIAADA